MLEGRGPTAFPFAPPVLRYGELVIAQTANILHWLAPRLGLVPGDESSRIYAHQLQLTIADFVSESHDVHHPISVGLYYEDQKPEAHRRAAHFLAERAPKYLAHFERILQGNSAGDGCHAVGSELSYVDLSLFQVLEGLHYAFPRAMVALSARARARARRTRAGAVGGELRAQVGAALVGLAHPPGQLVASSSSSSRRGAITTPSSASVARVGRHAARASARRRRRGGRGWRRSRAARRRGRRA